MRETHFQERRTLRLAAHPRQQGDERPWNTLRDGPRPRGAHKVEMRSEGESVG